MTRDIFEKRTRFKPFEYPELMVYKKAIRQSYWTEDEINFSGDVQDFHVSLTAVEKSAMRNTLLAISQVEAEGVKMFWVNLYQTLQKPEICQVGVTFGESEVRHADAYSKLLEDLHLNDEFEKLSDVPAIQGRLEYLTKYLKGAATNAREGFVLRLALFSLFIENVSLFSQFAIIKGFSKHRRLMKNVDNVVQATQKEETIHALFGAAIVRLIQEEHPDWFTEDFYATLNRATMKAYTAECGIIDWIFEEGELDFMSKDDLKGFIRIRFNDSLALIGAAPAFEPEPEIQAKFQWFTDECNLDVTADFFHKRPTTYSKHSTPITEDDLFD